MRPSLFRPLTRVRFVPRKLSPIVLASTRLSFHNRPALRNNASGKVNETPYIHLGAVGGAITKPHIAFQDLVVVDRLLEPQTVVHFLEFLGGNVLPNGTRPESIEAPCLSLEELPLIQSRNDAGDLSIMERVMMHVGSNDDPNRLCGVGKNIHSLKSRLWEGITPISDQRWEEKGLDQPANFDKACQHLSAVIAVFEYLNQKQVQDNLRQTFNHIHGVWEELDVVLNKKRAETGAKPISVADLWTLYMTSHLELVTQLAHKWVTQHVDRIRAPVLEELFDYHSPTEETGEPDAKHMALGDALQILMEISTWADHTILIPMDGYKGYVPQKKGHGLAPPDFYATDHTKRKSAYYDLLKLFTGKFNELKLHLYAGTGLHKGFLSRFIYANATSQIEAQKGLRKELRGDSLDLTLYEPWISTKWERIQHMDADILPKDSGMAIYRLTYGQSDSEWSEFVSKFESHMSDWGSDETGSYSIKPYLKLHWIDGRELGFAENDVEAAKRHFNETLCDSSVEDPSRPSMQIQKHAFLAVDSSSFTSYAENSLDPVTSAVLPDDSNSFVLAIDPYFDPEVGVDRPDECPDYTGQMRVLGSLIWGDLYAILESQSSGLPELWPLAMHHPEQIYVGPVIPLERAYWQTQKKGQWSFMADAVKNFLGTVLKKGPR